MKCLISTALLVLTLDAAALGQYGVLGLADEGAPFAGDVNNGGFFVAAHYNGIPILWDNAAKCTAIPPGGDFKNALSLGPADFLLVRNDVTQTIIEHWRTVSGQMSIVSSTTRGFASLTLDIEYDAVAGVIYWTDSLRGVIEYAVWSPSDHLSTLQWVLLVDSTSPAGGILGRIPVDFYWIPPTAGSSTKTLFAGEHPWHTHWGILLTGAPSQLQATRVDLMAATRSLFPSGGPYLDSFSLSEGSLTVIVKGSPGQSIEIVHQETSAVIGSGVIPPGTGEGAFLLSEAPVIGDSYYARAPGSTYVPGAARCLKRYTNSGVTGTGISFRPLTWPYGLAVGNPSFHLIASLRVDTPFPEDMEFSALGLAGLAARSSMGADPIVLIPQGFTIDPTASIYFPVSGGFLAGDSVGLLTAGMPVPADPSLSGQVVLFQMAIDDGTGLVLSDVIAVKIP